MVPDGPSAYDEGPSGPAPGRRPPQPLRPRAGGATCPPLALTFCEALEADGSEMASQLLALIQDADGRPAPSPASAPALSTRSASAVEGDLLPRK
jgi:hypothetical protein